MHISVHEKSRGSTRGMGAIFAVGLLLTIAAVLFGRFDEGQIDVSAVITQSNEEHVEAGEPAEVIPVMSDMNRGLPNGGLVGIGDTTPPPQPASEEVGTSTEGGEGESPESEGEGESSNGSENDSSLTEENVPPSETETVPEPATQIEE